MIKVEELKKIGGRKSQIPALPGVYKWWCTKEQLLLFMRQINNQDKYTGNDTSFIENDLLNHIEHYYDETLKIELYCIYVGKADEKHGLKKRIFGNHIGGNPNGSTFRKTIYGLKYGKNYDNHNQLYKNRNKTYVQDVIDSLFLEWNVYLQNEVDINEIREINSYLRIFNLDVGDLRDAEFSKNEHNTNYRRQLLNNIKYARNSWDEE